MQYIQSDFIAGGDSLGKMFSMHDQTRRFLTLLIFFLFGPILTLGLIGGIALRQMPFNVRDMERSIAIQTGMNLQIESLEYRKPNAIRLNNVRLTEGISTKAVFLAPEIDLDFVRPDKLNTCFPGIKTEEPDGAAHVPPRRWNISLDSFFSGVDPSAGFWRIRIPSGEIRLDHLPQSEAAATIRELFNKFLSRIPINAECPVQILADELNLVCFYHTERPEAKPNRIRFVSGNVYRTGPAYRSDWTFQISDVSETETERFSIVCNGSTSAVDLELKTGKTPIPCEMAAPFCSLFGALGPQSSFSGLLTAQYRHEKGASWKFGLSRGSLWNLDVARFAADYTPFAMTGTIKELYVEQATFGNGTFTAKGWLHAVSGSIERSLFHLLVNRFELTVEPDSILEAPWGAVPFDRCVVYYELQPNGMTFWAENAESPDLFMIRDQQPSMQVRLPRMTQPVPYHSILTVLATDGTPIVPLTPGSQKIMSMIPVDNTIQPTSLAREINEPSPNHSHTFLEKSKHRPAVPDSFPLESPQPAHELPRPTVANPWNAP